MSVNLTLLFEIIAFLAFIYSFKRFLWKPIIDALANREKTIADGLAAAAKGQKDLAEAEKRAEEALAEARRKASEIIDSANRRAGEIIEQAHGEAENARRREVERAQAEIEQASRQAREVLRGDFARIAGLAAGKIIEREIDPRQHQALIEEMTENLVNG